MNSRTHCLAVALAALFFLNAQSANADSRSGTTQVSQQVVMQPPASSIDDSPQVAKLSGQYSTWAGSGENSASLINGLRNGTVITLQPSPILGGTTTSPAETVTFTPPTQNMGWGNVTKALSLAQADLSAMGINNPTPQQLQAALMGGEITVTQGTTAQTTHLDGILTMRSQGMGWGEIAHALNLKPGEAFKPSSVSSRQQFSATRSIHRSDEILHTNTETVHKTHTTDGSSHATLANGRPAHDSHAAAGHTSGHTPGHTTVSRVVTAAGTPMATAASYHQSPHVSSVHATNTFVSRVTTSAGTSMAGGSGKAVSRGKSVSHGKL